MISIFPYIIPPSITIWDAAAPASSQLFALIGALILIPIDTCLYRPIILGIQSTKVRVGDEGYH